MSECVMYLFQRGDTRIGKKDAQTKQDIILSGYTENCLCNRPLTAGYSLKVEKEHALVEHTEEGEVSITPLNRSKTFVNGVLINGATPLAHGDRVIIGNNFVFRFHNPAQATCLSLTAPP